MSNGTMVGRLLQKLAPKDSIFSNVVEIADHTADGLLFSNGETAQVSELPIKAVNELGGVATGFVFNLLEKLDLPFFTGEAEQQFLKGVEHIAKALLLQFAGPMAKNFIE
ncbi:MAG: hypothetical protein EBR82_10180 [Caulobacteraceae bacterium]|nr:hypothetical protein [Caulobacteraceae bacterium]